MEYLLAIIIGYVVIVFILSRLFVPFLGFNPKMFVENISVDMAKTIHDLESHSVDAKSYAENALTFVRRKWHGDRFKTITKIGLAFRNDLNTIWTSTGYAHCTTINLIYYNLLTHSKYFEPEDIKIKHIFYNCFIHQYLEIRINGQWIEVDPSINYNNLPLGKRAHWFG